MRCYERVKTLPTGSVFILAQALRIWKGCTIWQKQKSIIFSIIIKYFRFVIMLRKILLLFCLCASTVALAQAPDPAAQLKELDIALPTPSISSNNFVKWVRSGNMLYLSGHGFCGEATAVDRGRLGQDLSVEQGYQAAQRVAICLLATLNDATGGDLRKVKRVVKVLGMVNSAPDFYDQPKVINGCSDLLTQVFGEKGKHARSAVGMASLPGNLAVEIEMIVELEDQPE